MTISITMHATGIIESVTEQLGTKPFSEGDGYAIYCTDCADAMKRLAKEVIDLTITSPPYNIGKEYESEKPIQDYIEWCEDWMREIHRLTKSEGAFWLNLGYVALEGRAKAIPLPYLLWNRSPFFLMQEVVWNYGAGVASRNSLSPRNEKLLWYVKDQDHYTFNLDAIRDPDVKYPNQKKNGKLRCNTIGKNPSDVWQIAKVTSGSDRASPERTPHPAQFPLDLIERLVVGFSNAGDLVLDPFIGSGTVAIACLAHGRPVIGFEIREDYCALATKRIKAFLNDQRCRLF
jgi:adenine-specific DNA-methyltransferase